MRNPLAQARTHASLDPRTLVRAGLAAAGAAIGMTVLSAIVTEVRERAESR